MLTAILSGKHIDSEKVNKLASTLAKCGCENILLAGETASDTNSKYKLYSNNNLAAAITSAIESSSASENCICIDANATLTQEEAHKLLAATNSIKTSELQIFSLNSSKLAGLLQSLDPNSIAIGQSWGILAIATHSSTLKSLIANMESSSFSETCIRAAINARATELSCEVNSEAITSAQSEEFSSASELSISSRSRCLETLVNAANIEDLFPNHAWSEFPQESAAAGYHTLAALFIKLGNLTVASQCIKISEQLEEDSPRSHALRGIIANRGGEVLGAVANMVSSLKQYEERKVKNGHYLSFQPSDLKIINSKLSEGLEFLNTRNNEKAFECFANAVFNFDGFYSQIGITK